MLYELCKLYESPKTVLINFSKCFYQYIRTENLGYKIAWNYLKNHLNCFHKLLKKFYEFIRTKNLSYKIAWNYSKITWIVLNTIFSDFKKCFKNFREYIRTENPSYKSKKIERKFLIDMGKNQSLKVKNNLLQLEKDFTE